MLDTTAIDAPHMARVALAIAVGALGSALAILLLLRLRARLPLAWPNRRSLHQAPVPRVGGIALWAGFMPVAAGVARELPGGVAGWVPAWLLIVAISLWDDARSVPVPARLCTHAACALWSAAWLMRASVGGLPGVAPGAGYLIAVAVIALGIAWSMNLYNFMDGSDGLAGATTLIGFAAMSVAASDDPALRIACAALAAASVPFLLVNRPPARMFMGDVGAVPAGYLAAMFGIGGALRGDWPAWFAALVFLPFLADATATLVRRLLRGERIWEAHRGHYYQRLHQLGAGHAGTLALYCLVTAACAITAVLVRARAPQLGAVAVIAWVAVLAILFAAIDYHWRRKPSATR
jgi:UDP-N-acetylmuramyl pentapeptide phosphotransferase/UDP-N-acetylglucosamine-1-phosphate transferase